MNNKAENMLEKIFKLKEAAGDFIPGGNAVNL